jgi:hypothetical protein
MIAASIARPRPRTDGAPAARPDASERARRGALARKASGRRRRIDPTTCDREYSAAELEFMGAMQAYKSRSGRMFPTWGEVLEVVTELGYRRPAPAPGPASVAP